MLRYKVRELLAEKSFVENRRITFKELCDPYQHFWTPC